MDTFLYVALPIILLGSLLTAVLYGIYRITRLWLLPKYLLLHAQRASLRLPSVVVAQARSLAVNVVSDVKSGDYCIPARQDQALDLLGILSDLETQRRIQ